MRWLWRPHQRLHQPLELPSMEPVEHELLVTRAAAALPPKQFPAFRRLSRELAAHTARWGLFLLQYEHMNERDSVAAAINALVGSNTNLHVDGTRFPDWLKLEAAIATEAKSVDLIHLFGLDDWLDPVPDPQLAITRLHAWNIRREAFARNISIPVVCWMRPATLQRLAQTAPDLWAWRAGVHDFSMPLEPLSGDDKSPYQQSQMLTGSIDNRTVAQRTYRVHEIRHYLEHINPAALQQRGILLDELAGLQQHLGQVDEALRIRREEELSIYEQLNDANDIAVTKGQIADIMQMRGDLDEALRIRTQEELPVYEKLGNIRAIALLKGKVADVLEIRGEFDEALRIRREDELPVYEQIDDVRAATITKGKIAGILQKRGKIDEALHIYRSQQLPAYERLGDLRAEAVTKGRIADILLMQGQLDEAMRIRREEQLPFYEKIGDVREIAVTKGKIAEIRERRGELNEALRICVEDVLPVFEQLGEVRSSAVIKGKIADILQARGEFDKALQIRFEEELPVYEQLGDLHSIAATKEQIADILFIHNEFDEALRMYREEVLPLYEKIADERISSITKDKIAAILQRRAQAKELKS